MTTPHDRLVREVFDRAARGTEAERTCALAPAYHHMPEVAREVEDLLKFHDLVDTPMDVPALSPGPLLPNRD